jgi:hypothetical protein
MKNEWRDGGVSFDCSIWMIAGNQTSLAGRDGYRKKRPLIRRRLRLTNRTDSDLVRRLTYNDDVAASQLAVFQGASDEHI